VKSLSTYLYVGLDGEMSSAELAEGGKLIQIGLTVRLPDGQLDTFSCLVNPGQMQWSEEAAQVHGIHPDDIRAFGLPSHEADQMCYDWLISHGADPKKRRLTIPVGFNIIGFDLPFVRAQLPKTYELFSRRMADLNGMLWMLQGKDGLGFTDWKDKAMAYAHENLPDHRPHDAGWDSQRHLLVFEYFKALVA
jgi:hypothetical protein